MSDIKVYSKDVTTKTGATFTAYETRDKNGNRVNVAFALKGKKPPEHFPCVIRLLDARTDSRKAFPLVRIYDYEIVEETKENKPRVADSVKGLFE